jgi:CRP-like cAMP-binding protein
MIQQAPEAERFKQQLRDSLRSETKDSRSVKIAKHNHNYTCGDQDQTVYFIESGQVKLLMLSPEGKECLLAIYTSGDIFGELCLSGLSDRVETVTAMEETVLKLIPCSKFFLRLSADLLLEGFVRYLAVRIADQQEAIANLVTVDSEQRLGKTLLQLARKLGPPPASATLKTGHCLTGHRLTQPGWSEILTAGRRWGAVPVYGASWLSL